MKGKTIVFDGNGAIAGRLATRVAKAALSGSDVIVVNSEKAVISGPPARTVAVWKSRRTMRVKSNPELSPKWPRSPDRLLKRMIKGMLPLRRRGKETAEQIKCYIGIPEDVKEKPEVAEKNVSELPGKFITILDLSKALGWNTKVKL